MANPADPTDEELIRHSLLGRYEAEDLKSVESIDGFTIGSDYRTSHDYLSFLNTAPNHRLTFDDVYVGRDGVYNLTIRFSNADNIEVNLNIESKQLDQSPIMSWTEVPFLVTGPSNWYSKTIPIELKKGINSIELSGTTNDLRIDFMGITHQKKRFHDPYYDVIAEDNRTEGKANQTIIFNDDLSGLSFGDAPLRLNASASSGPPITYGFTGPIDIIGDLMTIQGGG